MRFLGPSQCVRFIEVSSFRELKKGANAVYIQGNLSVVKLLTKKTDIKLGKIYNLIKVFQCELQYTLQKSKSCILSYIITHTWYMVRIHVAA